MRHISGVLEIALVLSAFCAGGPAKCQDDQVALPVEFYFSRWSPGHAGDGQVTFTQTNEPVYQSNYAYSATKFKLGLNWMQDWILFSDDGTTLETASLVGLWRPGQNLQVGIENLNYLSKRDELKDWSYDRWWWELSASWSNYRVSSLSADFAKLMYLADTVVGKGDVLVRGKSSGRKVDSDEHMHDTFYGVEADRFIDTLKWTHFYEVLWGTRDNLNLSALVGFEDWSINRSVETEYTLQDTIARRSELIHSDDETWRYSLAGDWAITGDLFAGAKWQRSDTQEDQRYVGSSSEQSNHRSAWSETSALSLSYLTTGEFEPSLLLDDYRGYYRRMLSKGQFYSRATIQKYIASSLLHVGSETFSSQFETRWAPLRHCEFGFLGTYNWNRFSENYSPNAVLESKVAFGWRSFDYRSDTGPGWARDTLLDRAYGPLLPEGGTCLLIALTPPTYSAREFVGDGPLDARSFMYLHDMRLLLEAVHGVTSRLQLSLTTQTTIRHNRGNPYSGRLALFSYFSYRLGVSYRLNRHFEISAEGADFYYPDREHFGDSFEFKGSIRGAI